MRILWDPECSTEMVRRHILARNVPARRASTFSRRIPTKSAPTISDLQIWIVAVGLIAVDLTLFMFPVVPVLAAYVLVVRPPWFKDFIDDVYDR